MKFKNISLLLLTISILILSCSKEDEATVPVTPPADMEDVMHETVILTESEYNEILAGADNKTWTSESFTLASMSQSCRLDDSFTFNANHTYSYNGGDNLCGNEDNATVKSGTWTIDAENNIIIFDENTTNSYEADVLVATSDELILSGTYMSLTVEGKYSN